MLQAWIVLPALYLAYILAAPVASLERRVGQVALSVLAVVAVSLSWMCVVALVPAHDRPYVDGSCDNSVFSQVFLYNGADRVNGNVLDQPGCSQPPVGTVTSPSGGAPTHALEKGPGRFLAGGFGRDAAWLFVPSLVALGGVLIARRREPRTDPWRAGALLWGIWQIMTWSFFSSSHFLNGYYLAALAPPMAALCGLGLALAWRQRERSPVVPVVVMATVVGGVAYNVYLVPEGAGVRPWIVATSVLAAAGALACLALSLRRGAAPLERRASASACRPWRSCSGRPGPRRRPWQTGSAPSTPRISPPRRRRRSSPRGPARSPAGPPWPPPRRTSALTQSVDTAETSAQVSLDVLASGREFLPVGGFSGQVPSTPLPTFVAVRATRARGRRPRPGGAADPQPRHALGPGPLQGPRRARRRRCATRAPRTGATCAGPRRVAEPRQTSRKRRMAMAEPMEPIAMPTMTTTTLVSKTSDPDMCMAVKMLLVVRPLPSWLMKR